MKNLFFCIVLLLIPSLVFSFPKPDVINSDMQRFIEKYHIPGAAVALVDGQKSQVFVYGNARRKEGKHPAIPVTHRTVFQIASVTKVLTTLLLAKEVDAGQMSLSDPITKYISYLKKNPYFDKVTLAELATHTAALPLNVSDGLKSQQALQTYLLHYHPRSKNIGHFWLYSNVGVGLLGEAISKQNNGDSVGRLCHNQLGINFSNRQVPLDEIAQGYTRVGYPDVEDPPNLKWFPFSWAAKANIDEMAQFLTLAVNDTGTGQDVGSDSISAAMRLSQTPMVKVGSFDQALAWQVHPLRDLRELAPAPYIKSRKATWLKNIGFQPNTWIDKTGSVNGFRAYIAVIPVAKVGVVLLLNKDVHGHAVLVPEGKKLLLNLLPKDFFRSQNILS